MFESVANVQIANFSAIELKRQFNLGLKSGFSTRRIPVAFRRKSHFSLLPPA